MKRIRSLIITLISTALLLSGTDAFALSAELADYAGGLEAGYKDGQPAKALFNQPYGLAFDNEGSLIVADSINNRIRKVKGDTVTTIAGFSDRKDNFGRPLGGLVDADVEKAMFDKPRYVLVDSRGAIFVSDTGNHAVRKIIDGKVYTVAGNGTSGYADGKGKIAKLNTPGGLAIDKDNNLYFVDSLNHVIRKISPSAEEVTTFAGVPGKDGYADGTVAEALFNEPTDIAMDKEGSIYVLDSGNQLVRKIYGGKVTTVTGTMGEKVKDTNYIKGGFADGDKARFNFPKGLAVADDGTLFIADSWNHRIRAVRPSGNVITIAGTGVAGKQNGSISEAMLNGPVDLAYRAGTLYISDMWNNSIRSVPVSVGSLRRVIPRDILINGITFDAVSEKIPVWVDKGKVEFPDVEPYVDDGRIYVPLRFICEHWGAQVAWNEAARQVEITKGSFKRTFTVNQGPIKIKDDRTVIHIRYLAEEMGFYVDWIDEFKAVVISTAE